MQLKILIADNYPLVRRGIRETLRDINDAYEIDEATNGQEVLSKIREKTYDVILLDISMPGKGGLEILKEIKAFKPKTPVLMLSMNDQDQSQYLLRSLIAGADGYIGKCQPTQTIVTAVQKVTAGRKYINEELAETIATSIQNEQNQPLHKLLSDREFEVFMALAGGKSVGEIAEELSLSVKTVSTYRTRILGKMQFRNNAQLTRYAIQNHFLT